MAQKKYRLQDLLDISVIQKLADSNFQASGLPMTIVEASDTSIIVKAGWPGACNKYHRKNQLSVERCLASDGYVKDRLGEAEYFQYRCLNGLWHIALPILVAGQHMATIFLTQFWFEGEELDTERFRQQAITFGFEVADYIAELNKLPVFSQEKVDYILSYYRSIARFIADLAEQSIKVLEARRQLAESEERYRSLILNMHIGVASINPATGMFINANPAIAHIFGYKSLYEFMQLPIRDIFSSTPEGSAFLTQLAGNVSYRDVEVYLRKRDGAYIWCACSTTPKCDDNGSLILIDLIIEDITESMASHNLIVRSEDRYRRLIDSVTDYIYTVRVENGKALSTSHSPACIAVTGFSSEEYESNKELWYQMIFDADRGMVIDLLEAAISGDPVAPIEHRIVHKDGSIRWVRNTVVPFMNEHGEIIAYDGMVRDITERKNAELALMESEERYRTFLDDFQGLAFKRRLDMTPVFMHGALEKITGYPSENFLTGKLRWHHIVHPSDIPMLYESSQELFTIPGHSVEREYRIIRRDGDVRWVKELIQNSCDETGKPAFIQGTVYDITDRKKLEEQLLHAQKTEAIGQLAGGVAHDFNNILSAMIGFTTLAQMKLPQDSPAQHYLSRMLELSDKASKLTNSLLTFSRKQTANVNAVNLNRIIANTSMLLERVIGEDIKLDIVTPREDIVIMTDASQIEQIIMNLASNSRDAMPKGGTLSISASLFTMDAAFIRSQGYGKPGRYALIQIMDSGEGMDPRIVDKIFDPFFTTKEVGKGTGLGLAIVYGIVKQYGGFVNVSSEKGKGTCFKIFLPVMNKETGNAEQQEPVKQLRGGTEYILVAEDERATRESLTSMLEEYGYRVISAKDGEEAVSLFLENRDKISMILLDVIMPVKSGKDAYDEIIALKPEVKVIFSSGYDNEHVIRQGLPTDGVEFISKPVAPGMLLSKIRSMLDTV